MSDVKFSKEHEWLRLDGDIATIGITHHATEMLGDIVFVELPEKGSSVVKDGNAGVVESTKAASDVYTPVSGEVVENNQSIVDDPAKINSDPENEAWFFKLKIKDKSELDGYLSALAAIDTATFAGWNKDRQLAFLINAYNAYTLALIIEHYPDIESIRDIGGFFSSPWKQAFAPLLGKTRTLDNIEHGLIRGGNKYQEPRIHFAVCHLR